VVYTESGPYILSAVAKHLIDLDEGALSSARAQLGTVTIKDTVNEALRRATGRRRDDVAEALDVLADARLEDRADAWR
jgi:Arc/MetJ family transcription regulator